MQEAREALRTGICKAGGLIESLAASIALHDGAAAQKILNQLKELRAVTDVPRRSI